MTNHDDLRHLLGEAARREGDEEVEATAAWEQGRRRRARKRVGASAVAGVTGLAVVAIAWQTGLFGGSNDPLEGIPATFPASSATFIFTPADAGDAPDLSGTTMSVPEEESLAGTTWELEDSLWRSEITSDEVIGSAAGTSLSVADELDQGWGIRIEDCGGVWAQQGLDLAGDGAFEAGEVGTEDIGCSQQVQTAEDFWMTALPAGGTLHQLDGSDVLLLSVPERGLHDPVAVTQEPSEDSTGEPPVEPTEDPAAEPTVDDLGGAWTPAAEQTESEDGALAGGPFFAPDLRAGRHEDFDRIVLDLTGDQGGGDRPGWVASYPGTAVMDGSGQPAQIGGDHVLQVIVSGMAYPEIGDTVYDDGTLRLRTPQLGVVVDAVRTVPFEGQLKVLVGMTGEPRPYRVMVLEGPMRVVIDVQR